MSYTLGIKRRFWPGYTKYRVTAHETDYNANEIRLIIHLADGSKMVIPNMDRRVFKLYPDFSIAMQKTAPVAAVPPPPQVAAQG